MTQMTLGDAFLFNPQVPIAKGVIAPFVGMADLRPFTRTVTTTVEKPFTSGARFVDGDVLMARITPSLENGKTSVYRASTGQESMPAFGSTEFIVIRGRDGVSDSRFAYYLFTSQDVRRFAISQMSGTSGRQRVQQEALAGYVVDLPSLIEQRGIAAVLGALDDKIESNQRTITLLESLARAHFDRLFDLTPDIDGVPLSSLMQVNPRRQLAPANIATYVGMSSLPEHSAEIYAWEMRPAGSGQRFMNGDVLMARITPCLENGKTAVVDMLEPHEVGWGSTEYVVLAPKAEISTPWIYCAVRNEAVRTFAIRSMTGTSGRQRFQAERFDHYKITPPDPAALKEFNTIAQPLFDRMTSLRNENLRAQALINTLLPELLSGRIRVPEATVTVSEVVA